MSSSINPYSINELYPVAGKDNDSQGFRDNFTNIKNALLAARSEISDLQAKGIFKEALEGDSLDNNFNNAIISNPQLRGIRETVRSHTTVTGSTALDFAEGHYQEVSVSTGSLIITNFDNWPRSGTHGVIRLEITAGANTSVVLPPSVTVGLNQISNSSTTTTNGIVVSSTIKFTTAGTYLFEFGTADGGNTVYISDLLRGSDSADNGFTVNGNLNINGNVYLGGSYVPSTISSTGKVGQLAFDTTYMYICVSENRWKRVALTSW